MKERKKREKRRRNGGVLRHILPTYYFRDGPASRYDAEVVSMDQACGGGRRVVRKRIGST